MKHSTKRVLQQILDICIKKNIHFSLSPHVFNVRIFLFLGSQGFNAYYFGELYNNKNVVDDTTLLLSDLLKKVKSI